MSQQSEAARRAPNATATAARSSRSDSHRSGTSRVPTNARARIIADRGGVLAEAIISIVRAGAAGRAVLSRVSRRAAGVITPLGWSVAAITPLLLLLGYRLGWMELVVVGWALVAVLAIAVLYLAGRNTGDVQLRVDRTRVVTGESVSGQLLLTNDTKSRIAGITVEVPIGSAIVDATLPGLRSGETHLHRFAILTARRGLLSVGPVRSVRADPVGLVHRELIQAPAVNVYVHPRTISIPSMSTGFVHDLEGNPTRDLTSTDISFHALREYLPGDERRYIHWKSSARTGRYMVRQFEETRRSHLVIALSLAIGDYSGDEAAGAEEFELAVSVAGSLGVRAIQDARSVTVAVSERTPQFAKRTVYAVRMLSTLTRAHLLDDLAQVEFSDSALTIADVARVTGEQAVGASVAFLVCGSGASPQSLRAASAKFPIGVEVIAVVCNPEATPGLRRVAGLSMLTVGFLDDLSRSLARSVAA